MPKTASKLSHLIPTDISATLVSGIDAGRAESSCTRLLLEFRSRKRFPNLASFRQVDAGSEIAFSKKDETFQESQGILSPLRLPIPPRPLSLGRSNT
jgi:hypothetical protein